jgi:hypothetical protein
MKKKLLVIIPLVTIVVLAILVYLLRTPAAAPPRPDASNAASSSKPSQTKPTVAEGKPITQEGTIECLKHRATDGPHDLSCAIGLKVDESTAYGLFSDDPTTTGSIPTGQRVVVTGIVVPSQTETYQTAGTIRVESIRRL